MLYGLENRGKNSQIISHDIRLLFYFSFILLQEPMWLVPLLGPSLKAALLVLSPNELELDLSNTKNKFSWTTSIAPQLVQICRGSVLRRARLFGRSGDCPWKSPV
jgi:hypothetical protein